MPRKKRDIQKEILGKLLNADGLRYTDARPARTENDLYNYHLQFLVGKGLVEKRDGNGLYYLTHEGKQYVDGTLSLSQVGRDYFKFRVSVLVLAVKEEDDRTYVLSHTRKRHPFYGETGGISGKVRADELVQEAALRKLTEETGLTAETATVKGLIRKMRHTEEGELFSDSYWFVVLAQGISGKLKEENKFGTNQWSSWDEAIEYETNSIQGSKQLADKFTEFRDNPDADHPFFYLEEKVTLPQF